MIENDGDANVYSIKQESRDIEQDMTNNVTYLLELEQKANNYVFPEEFMSSNITEVPQSKENVTTILYAGFSTCSNLETVELNSCETIGTSAFYGCTSLTTINFPSCTTISSYAFRSCGAIQDAVFPECTYIGSNAFDGCTQIKLMNFPKLESIVLQGGSGIFNSSGNAGIVSAYFPKLKSTCSYMFYRCPTLSDVDLSDCETVEYYTFYRNNTLRSINLPKAKRLGSEAFGSCFNLSSISMPECEIIGNYTFENCSALLSISMPKVTTIGNYAFSCCKMSYLNAPLCTSLGSGVFDTCGNLESFDIPAFSLITEIPPNMFRYCDKLALPSLDLTKMVSIGAYALSGCSTIAPSITSLNGVNLEFIGSAPFGGSGFSTLTTVSLPKLKTLGGSIVYCNQNNVCKITMSELYLPKCENLSWYAFSDFPELQKLVLPMAKSFTYLVGNNLSNLSSVYLLSTELPSLSSTYGTLPFYGCNNVSIYVRASLIYDYIKLFQTMSKSTISWYNNRFVGLTDEQVEEILNEYEGE